MLDDEVEEEQGNMPGGAPAAGTTILLTDVIVMRSMQRHFQCYVVLCTKNNECKHTRCKQTHHRLKLKVGSASQSQRSRVNTRNTCTVIGSLLFIAC